ncbi:MAG: T9SS type A sorting domain-containing protein [Cytophagales bacterium]|nr:T9SS type A sorting domain-containing protein [Cytophagales bacterium]
MPISLLQGEIENTFGGIGMHHSANASYDQFDDINAPRFIDFVEINFDHPEHFAKKFARDVVPAQEEYTWNFTIDGNVNSGAQSNWTNASLANLSQDLFLLDEGRQVIVNMREQDSYDFDLSKSKNYKIYYGNNLKEKVKPQGIVLGEVFPNPSSGLVTIPFTVSGNDFKYHVRMEIYDMTGRKIASLLDEELAPGFYSTAWDSTPVTANGLYTCRLTVTNGNLPETRARKIILSK